MFVNGAKTMRCSYIAILLLLTGCGSNPDIGNPFVNSIGNLASAFTAQDNLEVELRKDFARKSTQLRFISLDTYSCGDPDDPYIETAERDYRSLNSRNRPNEYSVLLNARKEARSKDAMLAAIASYGATISDIATAYKDAATTIKNAQEVVETFKKASLFIEATIVLAGLEQVLKIVEEIRHHSTELAIKTAAIKMKRPLREAIKALKDDKKLIGLSQNEAIAFSFWDACARERLRFIRDYYPSILTSIRKRETILVAQLDGKILQVGTEGMTRTSVLDIAKEVGNYLAEREIFIGRRPDYTALLAAIEKANDELTKMTFDQILIAAKNFGTLTEALPKATETIRKLDQKQARNSR